MQPADSEPASVPGSVADSYRFAPHFARTMNEANQAFSDLLSDHAAISVDLPIEQGAARTWPSGFLVPSLATVLVVRSDLTGYFHFTAAAS